ncbi:MAG: divalent metal cation transporter [Planctomycetaceae bacterium]|jgi:Mn2+/Fe2+ NRAMP family transporter|nr:divalent metal cation transporter [Planctomycetaceae bacterium]
MSENQQEQSKGLPMTAKWDPEKLEKEKAELRALESQPFFTRAKAYIKRSGPGLLQSAMTLGAGSAAASVVAGASFGYKLLWVQPLAMFLGVLMLGALSNIVLTTGERPYKAFMRELSIILVFLWAFGTIFASVIWHFPQYGLAAGAARSLVTEFTGAEMENMVDKIDKTTLQPVVNPATGRPEQEKKFTPTGYFTSFAVGLLILAINCTVVFNYGSGSKGIKIYEWFLRAMIALVIIMFAIVVVANIRKLQWLELLKGVAGYYGIPNSKPETITTVLGMLGAAVGINMTFLYPYSLLAKGWGKEHKTLARWDLGLSMFLPFAIVTSLIMIAMTVSGIYTGEDVVNTNISPIKAAASLTGVLGEKLGRLVFYLGLIGMTCSAVSTHMVVCGFTMCEMLGLEYTKTRFRLFALTPSIGVFGVVFSLPLWFPVAASAICLTMLPVAYFIFLILNNKRSFIGDAVGKGLGREIFNVLLVIALIMATIGAFVKVKQGVYDKIFPPKKDKPVAVQTEVVNTPK